MGNDLCSRCGSGDPRARGGRSSGKKATSGRTHDATGIDDGQPNAMSRGHGQPNAMSRGQGRTGKGGQGKGDGKAKGGGKGGGAGTAGRGKRGKRRGGGGKGNSPKKPPPEFCETCNEKVHSYDALVRMGTHVWHKVCFKCSGPKCDRALKTSTLTKRDDGSGKIGFFCEFCEKGLSGAVKASEAGAREEAVVEEGTNAKVRKSVGMKLEAGMTSPCCRGCGGIFEGPFVVIGGQKYHAALKDKDGNAIPGSQCSAAGVGVGQVVKLMRKDPRVVAYCMASRTPAGGKGDDGEMRWAVTVTAPAEGSTKRPKVERFYYDLQRESSLAALPSDGRACKLDYSPTPPDPTDKRVRVRRRTPTCMPTRTRPARTRRRSDARTHRRTRAPTH